MNRRVVVGLITMAGIATSCLGVTTLGEATGKRMCLVVADGYTSEYAWGKYEEMRFPPSHPGHDSFIRGLLDYAGRFNRWLEGWDVKRVDLEKHRGPLILEGVDLMIIDDVRQSICDPYEPAIVEFVRRGGGLLVYAGFWGLGGSPKSEYSLNQVVSSYRNTTLGVILPIEILASPDMESVLGKPKSYRTPVFLDSILGHGIDTQKWEVLGIHAGRARGEVLAELDGKPLICWRQFGKGTVIVYTGDDLSWIRHGRWAGDAAECNINKFSGTLWRRLASLSVGDSTDIPTVADSSLRWERGAAFAHPDQPMNFLWSGLFYYNNSEMESLWVRDLVRHSSTLISCPQNLSGTLDFMGGAGIQVWEAFGCPLLVKVDDQSTWMVDAGDKPVVGNPCYNNPKALRNMDEAVSSRAYRLVQHPWISYGHMGDETNYGNCYCEYCRNAFREQFGYDLPELKNDFSPKYLDQWIDYHLFRNSSVGKMYERAVQKAHEKNPRLKMFASLPQSGGMCHGDDLFHTQSGFDLLWDHTYPGTMAIRVGFNASLMEETAVLQGRPYVPILDLLQGFDSYDRYPRMPPAEYIREMCWQAISHGIDSIGWFVYNAFWWNLPGTDAWEEIGRLGREVLEPLTPTLYEMQNASQPVALLYSYSQEAVDGLKELVWNEKEHPWRSVIRWYSLHATHEAYEVLKYAHVPLNVISEHRLLEGKSLPWKVIIIPYAEHLHAKSRKVLESFMANGGIVYVGANSSLDMPGLKKLPVSFDTKFITWWPEDKKDEWNQRRVRTYMVSTFLEKAWQMRRLLAQFCNEAMVAISDPEVIYNVREAGVARYLFFINDHQINPVSQEFRKKRQEYNHFMLMPMEFPKTQTVVGVRGPGYLYPLLSSSNAPLKLERDKRISLDLKLDGGDGKVFLLLPEKIVKVEFISQPKRTKEGVVIEIRVLGSKGVVEASLPLRIDIESTTIKQTVYATTKNGMLSWTVPFLKEFPDGSLAVTITDLASGISVRSQTP